MPSPLVFWHLFLWGEQLYGQQTESDCISTVLLPHTSILNSLVRLRYVDNIHAGLYNIPLIQEFIPTEILFISNANFKDKLKST